MTEGKKINLRAFKKEDLEEYIRKSNKQDKFNRQFTFMLKKISDIYQQFEKDGLLSKSGGRLLIVSKEEELLGYVSFFKGSPYMNGYEIGYQIFEEVNRGKGYGTEAVRLATSFLFRHQPILRLQICTSEENLSSERVALNAGYTYEGTMRSVFLTKGKVVNNKLFSITRDEWEKRVDN